MSTQDKYGYFGPKYSFADNIPLPGQIGVRQEPSFGAIIDSVGGINYYIDTIAFGGRTMFDSHSPQPMGTRFFLNTNMQCSNGATQSEYFDGVTRGDLLGQDVENALASAGLPRLRGLAPGLVENAMDALDPRPIFAAVTSTGYPVCQQVQCPVGDVNGSISNGGTSADSGPYIVDPVQYVNGLPTQTRWVQAYDANGSAIQTTKAEFGATPKCYNADGTYMSGPALAQAQAQGCSSTPPASSGAAGTGRYALCTVVQPASLPPTMSGSGSGEGFVSGRRGGREGVDNITTRDMAIVAGLVAAAAAAVALWWVQGQGVKFKVRK